MLCIVADDDEAQELIDFPNYGNGHGEEKCVGHLEDPVVGEPIRGATLIKARIHVKAKTEKEEPGE